MYLIKVRKSKNYHLVYFTNGKRRTLSTHTQDYQKAKTFLEKFSEGRETPPGKKINPVSLANFKKEYVDYAKLTKSAAYIRSIELSFKMLIEFSSKINLSQLDLRTLDKFINITYHRAPGSAALYYRTLKAAFSKAVVWNYLSENPLKKLKAPKTPRSYPAFISESQLNTIIAKTTEYFLKDIFCFAFYTGMRLGEILSMKWSWINLKDEYIQVMCTADFKTKSRRERIIPMNMKVKGILEKRIPKIYILHKNNYVFYRIRGIRLLENYVSKKFKAYVRLAGIEDEKIHFHSLRHSFASHLVQKGASISAIKELLGHEELKTTQIYSHLRPENLRDAVNLF